MIPGHLFFDLTKKNDWNSFLMNFDTLSNVAYRVSLRGPEAELVRGVSTTPQQVVENLEAHQGASFNRVCMFDVTTFQLFFFLP